MAARLLLLLALVSLLRAPCWASAQQPEEEATVIIKGSAKIAETDQNYVCATMDWWPPEKCNYNQCPWGQSSILNLDLDHPFLAQAIQAFDNLRIRLGGSLQDRVVYDLGTNSPCTPFSNVSNGLFGFSAGCLSMDRWDKLNDLFQKTGAIITFGLNALNGRYNVQRSWTGKWNSTNAYDFVKYTISKGYPVDSWEFGNELSGHGTGARVNANLYGKDVTELKSILRHLYRAPLTQPLLLAPGGFFDQQWYTQLLQTSGHGVVSALTHHIYNLGGGLKINYHKSSMVPINTSTERCQELADLFGCKKETMPFTYLGLPMGVTKPRVDDLIPVISKIDKRLAGISNLLSYCSRLVVIKSIVSAMPNHIMCALKVHYVHIDHTEKSMRTFLWHGKEIEKKGKCLVKWEKVCLPKSAGGLGVLNLREQNKALLMKNLFKFFNNHDIPWVQLLWNAYYHNGTLPASQQQKGSFWWKSCVSFINDFKELTTCKIGDGRSTLLWHDKWCDVPLKNQFPELYSFVHKPLLTVRDAKLRMDEGLYSLFQLPLSLIASDQHDSLIEVINHIPESNSNDKWCFSWNCEKYSTKKVYNALIQAPTADPPFRWIWKSPCLPKQKFFFWLLIQDRLNTKDMMDRKHFYVESTDCVLCDQSSRETMNHLFFTCNFSRAFWGKIGEDWPTDRGFMDMLIEAKNRSHNPFFKLSMIAGCWSIWNHRNKIIFDGVIRDQETCFSSFKVSVGVIRHRIKPSLKEGLQIWIDSL